jgi:hypothetical protein
VPRNLFEVASTFGIAAPPGLTVHGYSEPGPFVPKVDPRLPLS